MIEKLGIGTDITDINKFKKITYSSNKKFYEKFFCLLKLNTVLGTKTRHHILLANLP